MKLIALALGALLALALVYAARRRRKRRPGETRPAGPGEYALALGHYDAGRLEEAEAALRRVVAAAPGHAEAHYKLGNVLAGRGQAEAAEAALRQALSLKPDFHQAWNNLGNLARFSGRAAEAEDCFRRALACRADLPEALSNLGGMLAEAGRACEAEEAFRAALRADPARFDVVYNLARLLDDGGRPAEAEAAYRQALRLNRDFPPAANALGALLSNNGRPQEAQTYFRDALRLEPDNALHHCGLGLALAACGQFGEAEAVYRQALAVQPGHAAILTNLAILRAQDGRLQEAEALYRQALEQRADLPETYNNLGNLYMETGRWQEAEATYRQAMALAPNDASILNLGHLQLLRGEFAPGWEGMDYRFRVNQKLDFRGFAQPRWDGLAFAGKTLLIHHEQGLGDSIQMFRFLPAVAALGGALAVECPASLFRLFRDNLPPAVRLLRFREDAVPDFDIYCPLMSLPRALQIRLETIPGAAPYLHAPAQAAAACPLLQARPGAPLKVGLVWAGSSTHGNDRNRSLAFAGLEPLLAVAGVTWVILQRERRPPGFEALAAQRGWLDPMGGVGDFADTAALVAQLDLVVGVDTSVIHLAGALGKPVWLLLPLMPDWRWLLAREDSPWYPGMRLFRQAAHGDWPGVLRRVAAALAAERDAKLQTTTDD